MPRYCDHTFFVIKQLDGITDGVKIGCVYCGHIRQINTTGDVTILIDEGKIIKINGDPRGTTKNGT